MSEELDQTLSKWKASLETAWRGIPKQFRNDHTVKRTLQCELYQLLRGPGCRVVADYMPPRMVDRAIDLICGNESNEIEYAVCIDPLVTLAAVKSLGSFESLNRIILTTSLLEKKVQESKFFLNPEITHVHLQF